MAFTLTPDSIKKYEIPPLREVVWPIVRAMFNIIARIVIQLTIPLFSIYLLDIFPPALFINSEANKFLSFWIAAVLCLPIVSFLSTIIHEIGHWGFGYLVGFRFISITIGPYRICKESQGLRIRQISHNFFSFSGEMFSIPTSFEHLRWRKLTFISGGPIATGVQILSLYIIQDVLQHIQLNVSFVAFLYTFTFYAIHSLILNLWPFHFAGGNPNDGRRIIKLLCDGSSTHRWMLITRLVSESINGTRPRDLSPEMLNRVLFPEDGKYFELMANILVYRYALDHQGLEQILKTLNRSLEILKEYPSLQKESPSVFAEVAYIEVHYNNDLESARTWLANMPSIDHDQDDSLFQSEQIRLRTLACILKQEENYAEAKLAAEKSLKLLERSINLGIRESEVEILTELIHELSTLNKKSLKFSTDCVEDQSHRAVHPR